MYITEWSLGNGLNCTAYMHSTEHTDICDIDNGDGNDDIMGLFEEVKM